MPVTQIERLKKDLMELENYAAKLQRKGKELKANNILKKKEFLLKHLKTNTELIN
jgi:hypothetical protein